MTNKEATRLSLLGVTAVFLRIQQLEVINLTDEPPSVNRRRARPERAMAPRAD
jgi:hypothetical protein